MGVTLPCCLGMLAASRRTALVGAELPSVGGEGRWGGGKGEASAGLGWLAIV